MRYPKLSVSFYAPNQFPDDGYLWRVEWLGRLERNFDYPYNHFLEVTLRRLRKKPRSIDVTLAEALDADPKCLDKAYIEIADLPYVHIGSIWRDGKYVASPEYPLFESDRLVFSESTMRLISLDSPDPLSDRGSILSANLCPAGCDPRQGRFLAVEVDDDPWGLLIPVTEIVRFYYCPSPAIASLLFRGPFDLIENEIYNAHHSGFDPDGLCRVCFRNGIPRTAARIAAVLATSEYARRQVRRIYDAILVSHVTSGIPVVETFPPFEGRAILKARGVWFKSGGHRRFLVYQLVESSLPLPGRKLLYAWSSPQSGRSQRLDDIDEYDWHPCLPRYTGDFESEYVGGSIYKRPEILRRQFDRPADPTKPVETEPLTPADSPLAEPNS